MKDLHIAVFALSSKTILKLADKTDPWGFGVLGFWGFGF